MEIILKIDDKSKQAKAFYNFLKTLPFVEIQKKTSKKKELDEEKEAFLYTSQKNASKLFSKYL